MVFSFRYTGMEVKLYFERSGEEGGVSVKDSIEEVLDKLEYVIGVV